MEFLLRGCLMWGHIWMVLNNLDFWCWSEPCIIGHSLLNTETWIFLYPKDYKPVFWIVKKAKLRQQIKIGVLQESLVTLKICFQMWGSYITYRLNQFPLVKRVWKLKIEMPLSSRHSHAMFLTEYRQAATFFFYLLSGWFWFRFI